MQLACSSLKPLRSYDYNQMYMIAVICYIFIFNGLSDAEINIEFKFSSLFPQYLQYCSYVEL